MTPGAFGRVLTLAALTVHLAAGGGGSNPTTPSTPAAAATPAPTPTPATLSGTWHGTTSQGLPIDFTVSGQQVTSLSAQLLVDFGFGNCTFTLLSTAAATYSTTGFEVPVVVSAGRLDLTRGSLRVRGGFSSSHRPRATSPSSSPI